MFLQSDSLTSAGLYDEARESRDKVDIQAMAVQVILPTGNECNGQHGTLVNLKSGFLQLGDDNVIIMNFDTDAEAASDFLATHPKNPDNSRTVLRVLTDTASDLTEIEANATEQINIRAKVVQIILPSQTQEENSDSLDLKVKDVTNVTQVGTKNQLYLSRQPNVHPRPCLRFIHTPKSPLSGVRGKRHSVELGYNTIDTRDSLRHSIEVEVMCHKLNTGEAVADSRACRFELADWRQSESYAKFWFRFFERNARYTLKFSLYQRPTETAKQGSQLDRKLLDTNAVSLEMGAAKTQRSGSQADSNGHFSTRKPKSRIVKSPNTASAALPLSEADVIALYERFDQIMQILLPLRDDGKWRKFDDEADNLLEMYTDAHSQAVIRLEQAVAASYRNDNARAELIFRESWSCVLAASDSLVLLLKGRAFCYLAGIRRRAEKLGDAEKLLRSSRQILEGSEHPLDLALLSYEEGSLQLCFMEFASCALKQSIFNEAKEQFDRCAKLRDRMRESEQHIYNLKHQFAVMKKAMLLLNSDTRRFRSKFVDESSIKEATQCLDSVQKLMRSKLAQAQYCLVRADQFVRQHCYEAAESFSLEAWGLSRMCGFDTFEIAKQQLNFIREIRSKPIICRES